MGTDSSLRPSVTVTPSVTYFIKYNHNGNRVTEVTEKINPKGVIIRPQSYQPHTDSSSESIRLDARFGYSDTFFTTTDESPLI